MSKTKQKIPPFSTYAVFSDIVFQIFWGKYPKFAKHRDFQAFVCNPITTEQSNHHWNFMVLVFPPPEEIHFWNISFFKVHINYSDIYIKHKIIVLTKRNQHDLMRTFNSDETRWFFSSICFISIDVLLNYIFLWK